MNIKYWRNFIQDKSNWKAVTVATKTLGILKLCVCKVNVNTIDFR